MPTLRHTFLWLLLTAGALCRDPAFAQTNTNSIADSAASSAETRRDLVRQYEMSPKAFSGQRLLAVAISYATENSPQKAQPLYEEFLRSEPGNTRALRGLGFCLGDEGHFDQAVNCFRQAWNLGDRQSLAPLALALLAARRYSDMEDLVPDLLKNKRGDAEVVACLISYALTKDPPQEQLIVDALDGLSDIELMQRDDLAGLISTAVNRLNAVSQECASLRQILRKVTHGYETNPPAWPKARLCGVADAYFVLGQHAKADQIFREVLKDNPQNRGALLGIGVLALYQTNFAAAITNCRKAWVLGNDRALLPLAAAYLMGNDLEGMPDLLPSLLKRKGEDIQILNSLVAYALLKKPKDKDLFFKAIDGISDDQILRRDDTANSVIAGLKSFGDKTHAERLIRLKARQDNGLRG